MFDEYPKLLYKGAGSGTYVSVANDAAEQEARKWGYGEYVSEYAVPVQVVDAAPTQAIDAALPSAADLDAVAAEQKVAEATGTQVVAGQVITMDPPKPYYVSDKEKLSPELEAQYVAAEQALEETRKALDKESY